jgi:peptide deformylase
MSALEIKKYPDKILKTKASPIIEIDSILQKLIDDMAETMYAEKGVGLAANQVGILKRLCTIDVSYVDGGKIPFIALINPEIIEKTGAEKAEEGCLSVPDYRAIVKRSEQILVRGLDRKGKSIEIEASGLLARVLQHEIDHLDGVLFVDKLSPMKRDFFKKRYKKPQSANKCA